MNLIIIFAIFLIILFQNTFSSPELAEHDVKGKDHIDHKHYDHHHGEDDLAGKLRYLPEFNVATDVTNKWSKFIELVQNANREYISTVDDSLRTVPSAWANATCAPFLPLVESDLKFFEDLHGTQFIDKNVIEQMKKLDRVVHYQIVNHRLYRDKACM